VGGRRLAPADRALGSPWQHAVNVYIAGIGKIVIVEALLALLLASFFFERTRRHARAFTLAFGLVGAASVWSYFNFGHFHPGGRLVHPHEQFHFYFGSKYLEEVRYDALYRAAVVAMAEQGTDVGRRRIRDPLSFEVVPASSALGSAAAVRGRFSTPRWQEFGADLAVFRRELQLPLDAVLTDHGNTGSPAWATVAWAFTSWIPPTRAGASALALLDAALLLLLFVTAARCFSPRVAAIGLVLAMTAPRAYDWLGGSILRLDWLFALGTCACALKVRRWKTAGVFLGYAIASKPFCALIALSLGVKMIVDSLRSRRLHRGHVALVTTACVALLASVLVSSVLFGGPEIWGSYAQRTLATLQEKYYASNYSFRDVVLQVRHFGLGEAFDWAPRTVAAALPDVSAVGYRWSLLLARLALLSLLTLAVVRHDEVVALGIGVLFVYVCLVTNIYYWQMLALPALAWADGYREDGRRLAALLFAGSLLIASHLFVHYATLGHLQGYFGSYWLLLLCLVVVASEATALAPVARGPRWVDNPPARAE